MKKVLSKDRNKMILLYLAAVVLYGILVSCFTATVHIRVDEELYLALAKSFHYEKRFMAGGIPVNYSCVLYSMLISVAYYFYAPERILYVMRLFNVCVMCSSVFPVWLLADRLLGNRRQAVRFGAVSLFLPCLFNSAYIMQEVLSYPLFLWAVYLTYRSVEIWQEEDRISFALTGMSALFAVLSFFTKTYLFLIPIVVNLCTMLSVLDGGRSRADAGRTGRIRRAAGFLAGYDIIYLLFFGLVYWGITGVNAGLECSNHYATQFARLFPISRDTVICGISCTVIYLACFVVNTGLLPLGSLLWHRRKLSGPGRWLNDFCIGFVLLLAVEIVVMIVLTEERNVIMPHKFLFRYFQVIVPILLLLFVRAVRDGALRTKLPWVLGIVSVVCTIGYVFGLRGGLRQAVMDGYVFLLLQNLRKFTPLYGDVILLAALAVGTAGLLCIYRKRRQTGERVLAALCIGGIMVLWLLNCVQLPMYTNQVTEGVALQEDSIRIADYLNENGYEKICYYPDEKRPYAENFYGYVRQPVRVLDPDTYGREELRALGSEAGAERTALLSPLPDLEQNFGAVRVELGTSILYLYLLPTA